MKRVAGGRLALAATGLAAAANRASFATETVFMSTGAVVWGIGRLRNDGGTADVGLHVAESVASAAVFIQVIPSMHAMASFAVASALTEEMRVRHTPHRQVVAPALYAAAVMPSLARMYLDDHWASDIGMGVFLGVLAGQKVVLYSGQRALADAGPSFKA